MKLTLRRVTLVLAWIILANVLFGWLAFSQVEKLPVQEAFIVHLSSFTGLGLDTQNLTLWGKTYAILDSALGLLSIPIVSALVAYRIAILNLEKLIDSYLVNKRKLSPKTVKELGPSLVSLLQQDPEKLREVINKLKELTAPKQGKT